MCISRVYHHNILKALTLHAEMLIIFILKLQFSVTECFNRIQKNILMYQNSSLVLITVQIQDHCYQMEKFTYSSKL